MASAATDPILAARPEPARAEPAAGKPAVRARWTLLAAAAGLGGGSRARRLVRPAAIPAAAHRAAGDADPVRSQPSSRHAGRCLAGRHRHPTASDLRPGAGPAGTRPGGPGRPDHHRGLRRGARSEPGLRRDADRDRPVGRAQRPADHHGSSGLRSVRRRRTRVPDRPAAAAAPRPDTSLLLRAFAWLTVVLGALGPILGLARLFTVAVNNNGPTGAAINALLAAQGLRIIAASITLAYRRPQVTSASISQ